MVKPEISSAGFELILYQAEVLYGSCWPLEGQTTPLSGRFLTMRRQYLSISHAR